MYFRGLKGTAKKNLERIRSEKEVLQAKIQEMKTEASKMANLRQSVENYCDMTAMSFRKKKRSKTNCSRQKRRFTLKGGSQRLSAKAEKLLGRHELLLRVCGGRRETKFRYYWITRISSYL